MFVSCGSQQSMILPSVFSFTTKSCARVRRPSLPTLARPVSVSLDEVRASLRRMHGAHMLVLQPTGEILMANPFSAISTPFVAEVSGRRWFGNCIWDALGIIATLHADGRVLTSCGTSGETLRVLNSLGREIEKVATPEAKSGNTQRFSWDFEQWRRGGNSLQAP